MPKCLCRIGIHRYLRHRSPDGDGYYEECTRCHKQRDSASVVPLLPMG